MPRGPMLDPRMRVPLSIVSCLSIRVGRRVGVRADMHVGRMTGVEGAYIEPHRMLGDGRTWAVGLDEHHAMAPPV